MSRKAVYIFVALWLAAALAVGVSGWYRDASPLVIAATVWSLVAVCLLAYAFAPFVREEVERVPIACLLCAHLTRFVGVWFLILYQAGKLPYQFAVIGGWGDIIAASLAIVLIFVLTFLRGAAGKWLLWLWNIFGLVDIIFVVMTAFRLGKSDPAQMLPLREFPLNLLPLFVVPLIIATHLFIFIRLRKQKI